MKNLTDVEIIESVKKGNAADYSILIDRYKNKVFSMLKRMLKNDMDAEEVLMDCFLKAYNNLKNFKYESKFSTWFYRIVYNTALTKLSNSKRKIENEMSSIDDLYDLKSEYDADVLVNNDLSQLVKKVVSELPPKNAAVITMFYLEEMTTEEISEVLEISVANVKVILHRSRNLLREIIERRNLLQDVL
ncbi:MAG: RNA polymerase sigma factor [Ignavibacteriaceae bacterium]|nr:RNA polymerase sigma factor [Ignavibacterium sp.]MCC6254535.1 RNA polymerase sigma factor [Ignavibacteriaceae bacterium]HRP92642.1 RNA polymerase sigma factor [Ignavibacteriaceae bacterium]HRQ55563.1 RNA polymerase sigma factor [Ignavibacteriaceae bacterium]